MSNLAAPPGAYRVYLVSVTCFVLAVGLALQAAPALAQTAADGPDAGEEPPGGPIVYNLVPEEGAVISEEELGSLRVGATIETQHDGGVQSAGISMDGQEMSNPSLGGPYTYLQSVSRGIEDLGPGKHTVEVTATDSAGRTGGHEWTFTVEQAAATDGQVSPPAEEPPAEEPSTTEELPAEEPSVTEEPAIQDADGHHGVASGDDGAAVAPSASPSAEIETLPDTGGVSLSPATTVAAAALLVASGLLGLAGSRRRRSS